MSNFQLRFVACLRWFLERLHISQLKATSRVLAPRRDGQLMSLEWLSNLSACAKSKAKKHRVSHPLAQHQRWNLVNHQLHIGNLKETTACKLHCNCDKCINLLTVTTSYEYDADYALTPANLKWHQWSAPGFFGLWTMAGCSILRSFLAAVHLTRLQLCPRRPRSPFTTNSLIWIVENDSERMIWSKNSCLFLAPGFLHSREWDTLRNCFSNHRQGQQWKNATNGTGNHWKPFFCHSNMSWEIDRDKNILSVACIFGYCDTSCQPLRPRLLSTVSRVGMAALTSKPASRCSNKPCDVEIRWM